MSDSCEKPKIHPSSSPPAFQESENVSGLQSNQFHQKDIGVKELNPTNGCRELNNCEKMVSKNRHEGKRIGLNSRKYKEFLKSQSEKAKTPDPLLGEMDKQLKGDSIAQVDSSKNDEEYSEKSNLAGKTLGESPSEESKPLSCTVTEKQDVCGATVIVNEKENLEELNLNSTINKGHDSHIIDYRQDKNIDMEEKKCVICCLGGKLLCCAGHGCSRSYHLSCVNPPFTFDQLGVWHCVLCVKKKVEMDVYSVSEGIESVLDAMETLDDNGKKKQYLVKYKGLAHVHNRWISEKDVKIQAPSILARFRKRNQVHFWKKDWSIPQRVLAKRLLLLPNDSDNSFKKLDGCHHEWLVKWKGLDYNHATWELENAPFLRTPDSLMLIDDFENRHMKEKEESDHHEITKERRTHFAQLEDLSSGCPEHLIYVNKLFEWWKRPQNAVIIDEQDRFVKVVLFLLSLLKETKGPFLILTTSTALPLWEDEFQQLAAHANVIVYNGSKDIRSCIRSLELFDEDQGIMFHVLLAHHKTFVEDLDNFQHVKWEVVLIDECQRPSVLEHSELVMMLATNMRLLLASNEIKDWSFNYRGALSLLDSEYIGATEDMAEGDPTIDKMKERLVQFTAYECKHETIEFAEFWVPVMLTDVQIEQYCASLFSKSFLLCSCTKADSPVSLHDLLLSVKKTCDHPFLVDYSLRSLVLQDVPEADQFDTEIKQSGKLQLLDKLLSEIKHQGLRVLVYFQAMSSPGMISIGDILDDFIHQKLGRDSYARIDGNMSRLKKKAALDRFNCKGKGPFVCLMEARACTSSIKVISVDAIFVYNSDWDPINDLRGLQKLTIHSQLEQLKVFRLYSSCTVEEKVLVQAKVGFTVDSNIRNIKKATCHKLLTWGASILFSKFDASSEHRDSPSNSKNCSEQTLLEDVFQELLCLLPSSNATSSSVVKNHPVNVVEVHPDGGSYLCIHSLSGELIADSADNYSIVRHLMDNEPPSLFWTNLLQRRKPRWRYMPDQSPRIKKKVLYLESLPEGSERNTSDTMNGSKEATSTVSHMVKYKPNSQKISQHSATKRCRSVHNLVNDNAPRRRKKKLKTLEGNGRDADQTVCPSVHNLVNDKAPRRRKKKIKTLEGNGCDALQAVCPSVHSLVNDNAPRRRKKKIKTAAEGNGCDAHQAVCPSIMGVPTSNGLSGGQISSPPGASVPIASEIPHSAGFASPVEGTIDVLASWGMHHENRSFVQASGHESQASIGASQPAISSPLDAQIQTMKETKEKAIKYHEHLKVEIESERRKELEEVNKKFDLLVQKAESALVETTTRLESRCTTLNGQKLLAEAMLQMHSYAYYATWSDQQRDAISAYMREIDRLFSPAKDSDTCEPGGPGDNNPSVVVHTAGKDTSASEPNANANVNVNANANAVAVMASNEATQLMIPTVNVPSRFCAQRGRAVRAPAPHLRNSTVRPTLAVNLPKVEDSSGFCRQSYNLSNDAILQ